MTDKPMRLGEILLAQDLVTLEGLELALDQQRREGGRLGESVVSLGLLTAEKLAMVLDQTPATPLSIEQTGIGRAGLLSLMLKFMRTLGYETLNDLGRGMKLSTAVLTELMSDATAQSLVQALGTKPQGFAFQVRYALTDVGRAAAAEALAQSLYVGPAPVSLAAFQARVKQQAITNENLTAASLSGGFSGLNMGSGFVRKLLPAIRSGRTVLLYGPPGNGKTSVATRIASLFRNMIYIPYAIEVNGLIVKVFDSELHRLYWHDQTALPAASGNSLLTETFDARWVACRRPVVMAGGELTLEMLELGFNPTANFYDAPLHMKALNGLFLIDDFGRQKVGPTELLNRWIVPLESRIDYLKLNSGGSFQIPFDELVILSTNLDPSELMDPAFLRRIPYKIEMLGPSEAEYRQVFGRAARSRSIELPTDVLDHIIRRLRGKGYVLAYFQPTFLCEQVSHLCECFALEPAFTKDIADEALENLYVDLKIQPEAPDAPEVLPLWQDENLSVAATV